MTEPAREHTSPVPNKAGFGDLPWSTATVIVSVVAGFVAIAIWGHDQDLLREVITFLSVLGGGTSVVGMFKADKAARASTALVNGYGDEKMEQAVQRVLERRGPQQVQHDRAPRDPEIGQ